MSAHYTSIPTHSADSTDISEAWYSDSLKVLLFETAWKPIYPQLVWTPSIDAAAVLNVKLERMLSLMLKTSARHGSARQ